MPPANRLVVNDRNQPQSRQPYRMRVLSDWKFRLHKADTCEYLQLALNRVLMFCK
jgi:hypothetical protein